MRWLLGLSNLCELRRGLRLELLLRMLAWQCWLSNLLLLVILLLLLSKPLLLRRRLLRRPDAANCRRRGSRGEMLMLLGNCWQRGRDPWLRTCWQ